MRSRSVAVFLLSVLVVVPATAAWAEARLIPPQYVERTDEAPDSPPRTGLTEPPPSASDEERSLFGLTNHERTSRGLPAMGWDESLAVMARVHASQMATSGSLYHNPNLAAEVADAVPTWQGAAENVGTGSSVESIHHALMNSPSHRDNILGNFDLLGIGVVVEAGTLWVVQVFVSQEEAATSPPPPPPPSPPSPPQEPAVKAASSPSTPEPAPEPAPVVTEPPEEEPSPEPTPSEVGQTEPGLRAVGPVTSAATASESDPREAVRILAAGLALAAMAARFLLVGPRLSLRGRRPPG